MALDLEATLRPLPGTKAAADPALAERREKAKLTQACRQFEAMFLRQMFKAMRSTVEKTGLMHGGKGEDMFEEMLDGAIADEAVKASSVGLADMLEAQMSRKTTVRPGVNAYRRAAEAVPEQEGLVMPVDGQVSSHYGMRVHPITGEDRQHDGLDLAAPEGTPVRAAADGVVSFAGENGGYGNLVVIDHADGSQTAYGHLQDFSVTEGQSVTAGQTIARVGSTGVSTGPHLHFEVRNAQGVATDPEPMLAKSHSTTA